MTRSPALIRDIGVSIVRAELEFDPDLLGAPRNPPWRLTTDAEPPQSAAEPCLEAAE